MIHIATIHYKTDKWVDIQYKYLKDNIRSDFRIYSFMTGLPAAFSENHFFSFFEPLEDHAEKLNLLAKQIYENREKEDDLILFLDGDAFPVAPLDLYLREKMEKYPLLAIKRSENLGDIEPHPSFCITTIRFWNDINGKWGRGYRWKNSAGHEVTDTGGSLLKILNERKIDWYPLQRTNRINLHPLWFGIYDDVVYHHGSGFREGISRIEKYRYEISNGSICRDQSASEKLFRRLIRSSSRRRRIISGMNRSLQDSVFRRITEDPEFYRFFMRETSGESGSG